MRFRSVVAVIAFALLGIGSCLAGKMTADPNASPAKAVATDLSDSRLARKISYEGGYKRLHYVIEELSAQTGVALRCGTNKDDWRVRDMPMAISARDIALGTLLKAIASSADLDFIAETIKDSQGKSDRAYRLAFTSRSQAAVDAYVADQREGGIKRQAEVWDLAVSVADSAEATKYPDSSTRMGRSMAKILKELGPQAKAKILSGQRIDLTTGTFAKPDMLRDLYRNAWDAQFHTNVQPTAATDEQIDSATLSIIPQEGIGNTGYFWVSISLSPICSGTMSTDWNRPLDMVAADAWRSTGNKQQPAVLYDYYSKRERPDHMTKDLVRLSLRPEAKDAPQFMAQKVKLDLPKDASCAETLSALAKATGLSIVAEDYLDHQNRDGRFVFRSGSGTPSPAPGQETAGYVLRKMNETAYTTDGFEWFYNEKTGLLVGRAPDWLVKHRDMMPESLLVYLKDKASKDGLELDDVSVLSRYTLTQYELWVRRSKDLYFIQNVAHGDTPSDVFWRFYERLSPEDKTSARSEAGLPLAKYDSAWVADFVRAGLDADRTVTLDSLSPDERRKRAEQRQRQAKLLTDPEAVRRLTLRITTKPVNASVSFTGGGISMMSGPTSAGATKHTYYPVLQGQYNGEKIDLEFEKLYPYFPVYSPKREAELAQKQGNKAPQPPAFTTTISVTSTTIPIAPVEK